VKSRNSRLSRYDREKYISKDGRSPRGGNVVRLVKLQGLARQYRGLVWALIMVVFSLSSAYDDKRLSQPQRQSSHQRDEFVSGFPPEFSRPADKGRLAELGRSIAVEKLNSE
jgi:hypothetical protein